ncbi:MAG: DUF3343 domain-containing protein [Oscillospiraceae bacterium]|nr:DUF3343 domain-containing protein [Oscillospiraceae bacterium]
MREKKLYLVVTFHTTAAAMAMEKQCKAHGVQGRLGPIPRELSSDCGMAWRAPTACRAELEQIAANYDIEVQEFAEIRL